MKIERPATRNMSLAQAMSLLAAFPRDQRGSLSIFAVFLFIMVLGIMGVAVDYTRAERDRATLQHTLDRAVLAAADLDQERPPAEVVQDYFRTAGLETALTDLTVDQGLNYKTLYARAEVNTHAPWLDLLGRWDSNRRADPGQYQTDETGRKIADANCSGQVTPVPTQKIDDYGNPVFDTNGDPVMVMASKVDLHHCMGTAETFTGTAASKTATIQTFVEGAAEERISNVEISMVLDVSGSMGSNNRMWRLRTAANEFIDTVLSDTNQDLVSLSVVPYDEHVSLGSTFYNAMRSELNINHKHNYSHCLEFPNSDFTQTGINWNGTYQQMQHTRLYSSWGFQCSTSSADAISPLSQNKTALKAQVNALQPSGNTHIFLGMKWAAMLLNPTFNRVVDNLVQANVVDSAFDNRPAAFDDPETMKTIVLMTDGQNTSSYRVTDQYYATPSHYAHWKNWGILNYLNSYVSYYYHDQFYYTKYYNSLGDTLLNNVCNAAKNDGIVIWSIGFEVNDHGANVMRNCASSPSHFFRVEGIEISDAFDAIARQINQLRLTQ
ncbi:MAG: Tad domain-containing protein [Pseudomonadota bacterium]